MYQWYEVPRDRLLELLAAETKLKAIRESGAVYPEEYYFILKYFIDDYYGYEDASKDYSCDDIAEKKLDEEFVGADFN